jgi:hypothetical protein
MSVCRVKRAESTGNPCPIRLNAGRGDLPTGIPGGTSMLTLLMADESKMLAPIVYVTSSLFHRSYIQKSFCVYSVHLKGFSGEMKTGRRS